MSTNPYPEDTFYRPIQTNRKEEKIRSLLLLHEATQKISSILDLDALLDKVVNEVAGAFDCSRTAILLKDRDSDDLVVAAAEGALRIKGIRFRVGRDGMVGHVGVTKELYYAPDVRVDPYYLACVPTTRSEVDIPLICDGELIGVFSAQHCELDGFSAGRRQILQALVDHLAVAVKNARLFQHERAEKERIYKKVEEARLIQQALFPKNAPVISGFTVEGQCIPADVVGGDWYDYLPLRDGCWGLVLADVSGKGMAAALLMTATRGIVRSVTESSLSPAEVLFRVNRVLLDDLPPEKFVTMVYAVLNPSKHTLTFANAGHPWPVHVNGTAQFLQTKSGFPLGMREGSYDEYTVELPEGSRVLFYSDGITEAENDKGEEYGIDRLLRHALEREITVPGLIHEVCDFSHPRTFEDDVTVIVVKSGKDKKPDPGLLLMRP